MEIETTIEHKAGRLENGRWQPGVSGNPKGRSPRKREEAYLNRFMDSLTDDKWTRIIDRAIELAIGGDHKARQWLSDAVIGRPKQRITISRGADEEDNSFPEFEGMTVEEIKAIAYGMAEHTGMLDAPDAPEDTTDEP